MTYLNQGVVDFKEIVKASVIYDRRDLCEIEAPPAPQNSGEVDRVKVPSANQQHGAGQRKW